jgi:Sec-independent protein translocase protein TatA
MRALLEPLHLLLMLLVVVILFRGRKLADDARRLAEGMRDFFDGL